MIIFIQVVYCGGVGVNAFLNTVVVYSIVLVVTPHRLDGVAKIV